MRWGVMQSDHLPDALTYTVMIVPSLCMAMAQFSDMVTPM